MRTVQWLAFDDRDMPSLHISELKKKTISHGLLSVNFRESDPSLAIYQGVRRVSPLSLRGSDNHPCRACNYW